MDAQKIEYLPHYVYEDYVQWEGRWELINGVPYAMAPSLSFDHQNINGLIFYQLMQLLADCTKCKALFPLDYKMDDDTILQPDALVICEPFEKGAFIVKAPEIVFEILSPSTRKKDISLKYALYEQAGVNYYVIVDPISKTSSIFQLEKGAYKLMLKTKTGEFDFNIMPCPFKFDFGKIW